MVVVRREVWTPVPWANGGGITHELVRWDGPSRFELRLSAAIVASDGPFSRFDGVDRTIVLLAGPGFRLTRADGVVSTVAEVGAPFAFHGEDAWTCTLLEGPPRGPVLDFNVMVDRARLRATVVLVQAPQSVRADYVLAVDAGLEIGGETLGQHDLARLDPGTLTPIGGVGRGLAVAVTRLRG